MSHSQPTLCSPAAGWAESEAPPLAVLSLEAGLAAVRFCPRCGEPCGAGAGGCSRCASAADAAADREFLALRLDDEKQAIHSALGLYFSLLAVCGVGLVFGATFGRRQEVNVQFAESAAISAITFGWCSAHWREVTPALGRIGWAWAYPVAIVLAIVTFGVARGAIDFARFWMHLPNGVLPDPIRAAGYGSAIVVLCTCVQPAVIEELAFRGVIFGALEKSLRPVEVICVTALMFMILHLSVFRFPHTLALGLVAGTLRYRTRSLYPGMLLHFFHNLLCVIAT